MPKRVLAQRYELIESIGQGGMGTVWRARDTVLGRDVAIKEVRLPEGVTPERREELLRRTMREGRICAGINHPSVIKVHDILQDHEQPWLVMELIDGRGLDRLVTESGPLDSVQTAKLGQQLVAALRTAHAAGVLHRDVKPANVLVTDEGQAILTDFGIATREGEAKLTITGKLPGAPGYVAPERMQGEKVRPESDLWSLGATLYFAVEGRNPYERSNPAQQLLAPIREEPDAPSRAGPLSPVLLGLLQRDPAQRLQGPALDQALARVAGGTAGSDMAPTTLDLSKIAGQMRSSGPSTGPQRPAAPPSPPPLLNAAMGGVPSATRPDQPGYQEPRRHWKRYAVAIVLGLITLIVAPLVVEFLASVWF
jgi:eukaryotic-like serine/threonine-protein kinase